jgi:hypothetical protein
MAGVSGMAEGCGVKASLRFQQRQFIDQCDDSLIVSLSVQSDGVMIISLKRNDAGGGGVHQLAQVYYRIRYSHCFAANARRWIRGDVADLHVSADFRLVDFDCNNAVPSTRSDNHPARHRSGDGPFASLSENWR